MAIEVLEYGKQNGVVLLTLPPHCSNKLQPLDVAVFSPFKSALNREIELWMLANRPNHLTIYFMASIINKAYISAFSYKNITSGFQATGIFPFDDQKSDEDYFRTYFQKKYKNKPIIIDVPLKNKQKPNVGLDKTPIRIPTSSTATDESVRRSAVLPSAATPAQSISSNSPVLRTPSDLFGSPTIDLNEARKKPSSNRRKGESTILTSTPEIERRRAAAEERVRKAVQKEELQRKKKEKGEKRCKKPERATKRPKIKKNKSDEECLVLKKPKVGARKQLNFEQKVKRKERTSSEESDTSTEFKSDNSDPESFSSLHSDLVEEDGISNLKLKENDFVLVCFPKTKPGPSTSKGANVYYVAQIVDKSDMDIGVSYLRKKADYKFVFPVIEDRDVISVKDVHMVLPPPQNHGKTARQASQYYFPTLRNTVLEIL